MEMINTFMNALIQWTLIGVSAGFCLLCVIGIWKWFFGVMRRALRHLFPGLKRKNNTRGDYYDESGTV